MSETKVLAFVDYEDPYVQPLILAALESCMPKGVLELIHTQSQISAAPDARILQWRQYESLDLVIYICKHYNEIIHNKLKTNNKS